MLAQIICTGEHTSNSIPKLNLILRRVVRSSVVTPKTLRKLLLKAELNRLVSPPVFSIPKNISVCRIYPLNYDFKTIETEILEGRPNVTVAFYKTNAGRPTSFASLI